MFSSILIPIDLDQPSSWEKAVPLAVQMARASGGVVHVTTIVPPYQMAIVGSFFPADHERKALDAAKVKLREIASTFDLNGVEARFHVAHGPIYDEILRCADVVNADLIVVSSHRPELKDYLLGPNAARVVRHAKQSVMVVRD